MIKISPGMTANLVLKENRSRSRKKRKKRKKKVVSLMHIRKSSMKIWLIKII